MKQILSLVTLLVDDYDAAIAHYTGALGFELLEDTDRGSGILVRPGLLNFQIEVGLA